MKRGHSRSTYPADKMVPREVLHVNGRWALSPAQRKTIKRFHTRKQRRWLTLPHTTVGAFHE